MNHFIKTILSKLHAPLSVATLNILGFAKTPYKLPEIEGVCERFLLTGFCTNIIVFCDAELSIYEYLKLEKELENLGASNGTPLEFWGGH